MKSYPQFVIHFPRTRRQGSTLVIVIALLGLLSFIGMVFFTFASQERAASEYFSDAAKAQIPSDDNIFDWGLRHVLIGPTAQERNSILYSPTQRHSMVKSVFGSDVYAHTGAGVQVVYDTTTVLSNPFPVSRNLPAPDGNSPIIDDVENQLNMVDSPRAWGLQVNQQTANNELARLFRYRGYENIMPDPDVDYTSPDINTMFIAYRGWAIRDNREDLNNNGTFDPAEDLNSNGILDPAEDRNNNGVLDPGEDLDMDGSLDPAEDRNSNGVLDPAEVDRNNNMTADVVNPAFEMVPVTIPSFFRPQYLKTATGPNRFGNYVPTDPNWVTTDPLNTTFAARSFRPHPSHKTRNFDTNAVLPRYLDAATASALSPPLLSGGFPLVPTNSSHPDQDPSLPGELGIFTGSHPSVIELDVDNDQFVEPDGNTTNEGIWLDLDFPIQEMIDSTGNTRTYVVLHSFTIYDLDSLINTNVHGNLAGLDRSGVLNALVSSGALANQMLSKSNLGLGPNEVNPSYALRRDERADNSTLTNVTYVNSIPTGSGAARDQFIAHFGRAPENAIEQANMELFWLLTGRAKFDGTTIEDVYPGRWGDVRGLYSAVSSGAKSVFRYPRPGRADNQDVLASTGSGPRFGGDSVSNGRGGYDDNQDRYEGEAVTVLGKYRPFGHPMDFSGAGRYSTNLVSGYGGARGLTAANGGGNPLLPDLLMTNPLNPASWLRYTGYSMTREVAPVTGVTDPFRAYSRYIFGTNNVFDGAAEQLMRSPLFDPLFEDPLEQIFDPNFAQRPQDNAFGPQDTLVLQMAQLDVTTTSVEKPSGRLPELAPFALDSSSRNREMLTTYSNSYRYVPFLHPYGSDGRPGLRNIDDDGDGLSDEADEVLIGADVTDLTPRWWEFTADADGADSLDASGSPGTDGFPDGDGNFEFPPKFGNTLLLGKPYGPNDPFRPQVRRILTVEAGERQGIVGQLPLSINQLLDVDRSPQTPAEGTKEFLYFMQRSGLKFRSLTEHPSAHVDADGNAALDMVSADLPQYEPAADPTDRLPTYPPQTIAAREFWARRDRQQMARDIYVLLYTLGGARKSTTNNISDYRRANDPNLAEDAAPVAPDAPNHLAYFTTAQPLYTHRQLRRMAQFAVNVVDAMDTDNIVTKFEYDKNLGPNPAGTTGGWELDDNPYTSSDDVDTAVGANATENMLYREDTNGRGVVYGVEAQQLALSEVLAIRSEAVTPGGDSLATPYTDDQARDFLFVELQNILPMELDLATPRSGSSNPERGVWRIVRNNRPAIDHDLSDPNDPAIIIADHAENIVDGGGRFSISVTSDTTLTSSAFFVDLGDIAANMFDGVYELIAPDVTAVVDSSSAGATEPLTDIDVRHTNHVGRFAEFNSPFLADPTTVPNYQGNDTFDDVSTAFPSETVPGFDLVLQRRLNPDLPSLGLAENPWIEVDRRKVTFQSFQLTNMGGPAEVYDPAMPAGQILGVESYERIEPLESRTVPSTAKTVTPHRLNTIKGSELAVTDDMLGVNSTKIMDPLLHVSATNEARPFNVWQPHFDRDYASSIDLLNLPVFGPQTLTQQLQISRLAPFQQILGDPANAIRLSTAAGLFLMPDFPDVVGNDLRNQARDNRWYRILQFVEVPSRVHRMLGNYLTLNRLPGKINLNMIRHREVYAGLIDSPFLMDVPNTFDTTPFYTGPPGGNPANQFEDGPFTHPAGDTAGTDRWREFLEERDGLIRSHDPTGFAPGAARFQIPGLPNSNPFRTLASRDEFNPNPLQSTILRTLRQDRVDTGTGPPSFALTNRHWLEVGTPSEHDAPDIRTSGQQKHQLLGKIQNNATTISNTFIVFGTAGFFEAFEHTTGANAGLVQVGGPLDMDGDSQTTDDRKRAAFLIDRTEALNAYDPGTGGFDWSKLVKTRLNIVE